MKTIAEGRARITEYLSSGGLFNPEAMEHDKVRNLLMDLRTLLESLENKINVIHDQAKTA